MSLTADSFTTFATTPLEAGASGQEFDLLGGFYQGAKEVKGEDIKPGDIAVKSDRLGSLDFLKDEDEEEEGPEDALTNLRKSISKIGGVSKQFDVTPDLKPVGSGYSANVNKIEEPMRIPTNMGIISAATGIYEGLKGRDDEYYNYIDSLANQYAQVDETGAKVAQTSDAIGGIAEGIDLATDAGFISGDPITSVGGYNLAGYDAMKLAEAQGTSSYTPTPTGAPSLAGQVAGAGMTVASAYSAYDALKGGIDSPMEGAQAVSGVIGTVAGLNAMGLISTPGFMAAAGPIGWALAGASLLYSSGIIGGKGKSKPPMGGVEFRLVDDAGKQYSNVQEGQKRRIKAVNPHSYNGFNSSALLSQANKNVDYLYAFADEFDLEVNEDVWADAAFGANNTPKYMPKGRQQPYRSALERIDSMGDGSSSPSEWLRHAMEYESPDGRRIIDGQIYKGVRIGPNGLPMKVGYKTQEEFQEAVADFNKRFYGE